jgi:hypothetical protein
LVLGQGIITTIGNVTSASFTTTLVGNHNVTAYFPGGGSAALPSSTSGPVKVKESGSTISATSVSPSLSAAAIGLPVTLTATVTGPSGTPTGTVSFYDGSVNLANLVGTSLLDGNGVATLVTSFTAAGKQHVIAVYNGDDTYAASHHATNIATAANAMATITSSANYVPVGSAPTYTVTVSGNGTLGTPSGTVQFFLDGTALGSPQTLVPGDNDTATASVISTPLSAGSHFVTVSWTADSPYASFTLDTTTATNGVAFIETAQQPFTPGDLVAVQRGDGSVNLGSSGYLVFLDEYTPAGMLVQKIALPNVDSDAGHALLLSGQNGAEGLLNRSADGYYLTLAGYDVPVGQQFVTSTFPFQFARTIARIDGAANVDTSTAISTTPDSSVPYNPAAVVSLDGNEFWLVSNLNTGNTTDGGIEYIDSLGETGAIQIGPVGSSGSFIGIAGGQLYASSTDLNGGAPVGVWQVGMGLPTMSTMLASLPGLQAAYQAAFPNQENPKQLLFFNHNDGTSNNPDTLYVADQSNGLLKFWFDGTTWHFGNATGGFGQKLVFAGGATGVIGYVVNPGPNAQFQLYVTGNNVQGQNPNQIARFFDTNAYNNGFAPGNFSTLAYVGDVGGSPNGNENFAGLAFVPGYQTTTTVTSSGDPAMEGDTITLTATVTATKGTPTGVVRFYDGTTLLATVPLDVNGVATFSTSALTLGRHPIIAIYQGDVQDGISVSTVLRQGVQPPQEGRKEFMNPSSAMLSSAPIATVAATDQLVATDGKSGLPLVSNPDVAVTTQAPSTTVTSSENRLQAAPVQQTTSSEARAAEGAKLDAFWRHVGVMPRRTISPWSFDLDDSGDIAG